MSRFLLNLRNQRTRNERQSVTLAPSMDAEVDWDSDVLEKDGDLWRCDTNASTSTGDTVIYVDGGPYSSSELLVRGEKDAA